MPLGTPGQVAPATISSQRSLAVAGRKEAPWDPRQFAVAGVVVLLLLEPVFGCSARAGALIEMSFAGGHGTLAGLAPILVEYDAEELLEVGLGLATIGMVAGIVIGTMLVNYAVRSPSIPVARQRPTSPDEDLDIDHHLPRPDDEPMDEAHGMTQVTAAAVFLGVSIAVGYLLLQVARLVFGLRGANFFEKFPLFPFTIVGGVLVQLCAVRFGFERVVNRGAVEGLGGLAVDGIVLCAIGTRSVGALGSHLGPLIVLAVASVAWSVFVAMVIGRRVFPRDWFEHSLAEFEESQGNVAVPLIASWGLPAFTIANVAITTALAIWGMSRRRRATAVAERAVPLTRS